MPVSLPNFNIVANVWPAGVNPRVDPPAFNTNCQFYIASRGFFDVTPGDNNLWQPPIYLRVPKGTGLVLDGFAEVEAGSNFFYRIRWVERMHLGFPNEYLIGILEQS